MLIYCKNITSRFIYISNYLIHDLLGLTVDFTADKQFFNACQGLKLNYSEEDLEGKLRLIPCGLLSETGIRDFEVITGEYRVTKTLFPTRGAACLPFDMFSAAFYLLTRYEEYLPFDADVHGRYKATDSLAFKQGFLDQPVINIWLEWLKTCILDSEPGIRFKKRKFKFIPTIDVDQAFAYRHKGIVRNSLALGKALISGKLKECIRRSKVLLRIRRDPFDTFDTIFKIHGEASSTIWFILFGKYGKYDKNLHHGNAHFRKLIISLGRHGKVGIHPSYGSNDDGLTLKTEVYLLSDLVGQAITHSRQHFLRMRIPSTYRALASLGIKEDYTMGYGQLPGFRAGICDPFPFYDLEKEEQSSLVVYPFTIMDGTLKDIMRLSPDEAMDVIESFVEKVKAVNGTFISIWHNESLSGQKRWRGWVRVYEELNKMAGI